MKYKMYKINPANLDQHVQLLSLYAQFLTFIFSEKYDNCNCTVVLYEVKIVWWQGTIQDEQLFVQSRANGFSKLHGNILQAHSTGHYLDFRRKF